jgi:hypothetical protein
MSTDDIDRPSAATADGDTKNMSRIQLRTHGLLGNDENSTKIKPLCARQIFASYTRLSLYFLAYNGRGWGDIIGDCIAVRKYR